MIKTKCFKSFFHSLFHQTLYFLMCIFHSTDPVKYSTKIILHSDSEIHSFHDDSENSCNRDTCFILTQHFSTAITDIWVQSTLCCRRLSCVDCRTPGLCPLDTSSVSPAQVLTSKTVSSHCQQCCLGQLSWDPVLPQLLYKTSLSVNVVSHICCYFKHITNNSWK